MRGMAAFVAIALFGLRCFQTQALAQFTLQLNSGNTSYSIIGYTGVGGNVVIPSVISNLPVTIISDYAFQSVTSIKSLVVPDSVMSIGHNSFAFCTGITSVSIGNGVSTIGLNAFYGNSSLTNVVFGTNVQTINTSFQACLALISMYFNGNAPTQLGNVLSTSPITVYRYIWTTGWGSSLAGQPVVTLSPSGIATQPISQSVAVGSNAFFSILVTNTANISYQWFYTGPSNIMQAGAYAQIVNGFVYNAVVTNSGSGYGNIAHVSFVGGGGTSAAGYAVLSNNLVVAIAITNAGLGYTAQPSVVIDPPNGSLYGQTNNILIITNASAANAGNYYVVVNNSYGSFNSSNASLTVQYPPSITTQPQDYYVNAHSNALFSVVASGTSPISYTWFFTNSIITNASGSTLIVSNITPANLGGYSVFVYNGFGSVTSHVANLYMYPYIAQPFKGVSTYWGQTNTLSVGAWGSGNLTYQWYFNGSAMAGATNATLSLGAIQFSNAGQYSIVIGNSLGSVTNIAYQVVVNSANVSIAICPNVVIQGTLGYNYTIQSTTDLSNTNSWIVETNITLTSPIQYWDDTSSDVHNQNKAQKYYRVVAEQ